MRAVVFRVNSVSHSACASAAVATPSLASRRAYSSRVVGRLLDRAIHDRLREGRLVILIMPVAAIADDVQHEIRGKLLAKFRRHARREHHRFRLVPVHMQDRHLNGFRNVRAIQPGIRMRWHRGEADLVVHDHMDRPARAVAVQLAHRQRLIHQALARERRVAMQPGCPSRCAAR